MTATITTSTTQRIAAARRTLAACDQEHVLAFIDDLDEAGRMGLLAEVEAIDWPAMARLVETHVIRSPPVHVPAAIEPAPAWPATPTPQRRARYDAALDLGHTLVREGKVAAFTVAGGQGTRLGLDGPKGAFRATPIRRLPLFGCLAEYLLRIEAGFGRQVPWYVMTSAANHAETLAVFERHAWFGLDPQQVTFFPQAMLPAFDLETGRALLQAPGRLALSPDGHGGSLKALYNSGAIADMAQRGVEQISYTQIDNPLVKVIDPLFVGLHALEGAQMSSKAVAKASAQEKVGNLCTVDGRITVIEYSDLPDSLAEQRDADGHLRFAAGSIAIHMIDVEFVRSLNQAEGGFALPYHRAQKRVPCIDPASGRPVTADAPNAVKFETFVFDALPLCERSLVFETERASEFAPIKNEDGPGAVDCPATSIRLQVERAAAWLEAHGVRVPRTAAGDVDAVIEIQALTAIESADLDGVRLPDRIEPGSRILL